MSTSYSQFCREQKESADNSGSSTSTPKVSSTEKLNLNRDVYERRLHETTGRNKHKVALEELTEKVRRDSRDNYLAINRLLQQDPGKITDQQTTGSVSIRPITRQQTQSFDSYEPRVQQSSKRLSVQKAAHINIPSRIHHNTVLSNDSINDSVFLPNTTDSPAVSALKSKFGKSKASIEKTVNLADELSDCLLTLNATGTTSATESHLELRLSDSEQQESNNSHSREKLISKSRSSSSSSRNSNNSSSQKNESIDYTNSALHKWLVVTEPDIVKSY
jgi:hypothetical protein